MPDALEVFLAYYGAISAIEWPLSSKPEDRFGTDNGHWVIVEDIGARLFRMHVAVYGHRLANCLRSGTSSRFTRS